MLNLHVNASALMMTDSSALETLLGYWKTQFLTLFRLSDVFGDRRPCSITSEANQVDAASSAFLPSLFRRDMLG